MPDTPRNNPDRAGSTEKGERESIPSSNDTDQMLEREDVESKRDRGYDDAGRGRSSVEHEDLGDVDPDSARSDVDRDDTATE